MNPAKLTGPWDKGYSLDVHIVSSEFIGYSSVGNPQFNTVRTELGEMLYKLKYARNKTVLDAIAKAASDFIGSRQWPIDLVIPVPPSNLSREFQPVYEIAQRVASNLNIPYCQNCVEKIKDTPELKGVYEYGARMKALAGAFEAKSKKIRGKKVLLLDDLYRSGATLKEVAKTLTQNGEAKGVYVLTITRTKNNS